jgi:menaquinone-dependent protoporphyrinogen oxidase
MKILVTYASRTGSTVGVAQTIAQTLVESGAEVDIYPVQDVQDITPYTAVVVGSAINSGRWLPDAMQFVEKHQAALAQKPFAAFLVCITMTMKNEQYHEGVKAWMEPVRKLVWPVSEGYFAGMLDFNKLPLTIGTLLMRATVALGVWAEGDNRDWDAIRAWAKDLAVKFQLERITN